MDDESRKKFEREFRELEDFVPALLLEAFQKEGALEDTEKRLRVKELRENLGVIPKYKPLFLAMLDILERGGLIGFSDKEEIAVSGKIQEPGLKKKEELESLFPTLKDHLELLRVCLDSCFSMLRGETDYANVLFPEGSLGLVDKIYQGNASADHHNSLTAGLIADYLEKRLSGDPEGKLNIMEVGAGTGATSRAVLEKIKPFQDKVAYYFTDISQKFIQHAQDEFQADYPFLKTRVFNIELDPEDQGIETGSVDLVLGVNVLHATGEIEKSLAGLKRVLKSGGILLLGEITGRSDFLTLSFGFTDGWWLFKDAENRIERSPLLSVGQWRRQLRESGFLKPRFFGESAEKSGFRQVVVAAESDGLALISKRAERKSFESETNLSSKPTPKPLTQNKPSTKTEGIGTSFSEGRLKEETIDYLKTVFAEVLRIDKDRIKPRETFENYGVDSLMVMEINKELAKDFGPLSASLLFENATLERLSDYFMSEHGPALKGLFSFSEPAGKAESLFEDYFPEEGRGSLSPTRGEAAVKVSERPSSQGLSGAVAVVGLAGRYPGSENLEEFWRNLKEGKNCVSEVPGDRWNWRDYYDPDKDKKGFSYSKWGGFISGVDRFDSLFFNISPREAEGMDPQERMFLETAWHALEDSGRSKSSLSGSKTGVFVGVMNADYQLLSAESWAFGGNISGGSEYWSMANRVSYFFDWRGPSMAVDTACSSSLSAVHLACRSLRHKECELALAGGVNLILHPLHFIKLCSINMITPNFENRSFGAEADGFVPGEGVGAVLLKPLEKAIEDGDRIYGVIKGSRMNAGGKTGGYTVPNPEAQGELVREALETAGVDPRSVSYVEAHGTGTSLGDPIEIAGLKRAFEKETDDKQYCSIGSVKSNVGHLESAAGIAGLTKVLLQLKHKQLAPSLHSEELNPHIDFEDSPFYVQRELSEWKSEGDFPRRAGLSSFGAGGANAHLIVEEYRAESAALAEFAPPYLIVLSAKNENRLKICAENLLRFLEESDREAESDITLQYFMEGELLKQLSGLINIPVAELDKGASFEEQGIEPLKFEEWRELIEETYSLNLDPAVFTEYPSLDALFACLADKFSEELSLRAKGLKSGKASEIRDTYLPDLAYTLQVGREAMEERLALVVDDNKEVLDKLREYLRNGGKTSGLYLGNVAKNNSENELLVEGKAGRDFINALIAERNTKKLARLWVGGAGIDWSLLYGDIKPRKISPPTYPCNFSKSPW